MYRGGKGFSTWWTVAGPLDEHLWRTPTHVFGGRSRGRTGVPRTRLQSRRIMNWLGLGLPQIDRRNHNIMRMASPVAERPTPPAVIPNATCLLLLWSCIEGSFLPDYLFTTILCSRGDVSCPLRRVVVLYKGAKDLPHRPEAPTLVGCWQPAQRPVSVCLPPCLCVPSLSVRLSISTVESSPVHVPESLAACQWKLPPIILDGTARG